MNIRFTICDLRVRGGIGASGVWRGLGGLVVRRGETKTSNTEHRMRDGKESRTRTRTRTTTRTKLKITNAQAIMTNQFSNCQIPDGEHFGAFRSLWGGGVLAGRGARNYKKRLISRIIPPFPAYSRVLKGKFFPVFLDSVAICRLWSELWLRVPPDAGWGCLQSLGKSAVAADLAGAVHDNAVNLEIWV